MIFAYNIIMLIAWFFFNVINVFSFLCLYSLYLEMVHDTNLDHAHMLKVSKFLTIKSRWQKLKFLNQNQAQSLSVGSRSVIAGNRGCTTASRSRTPSVLSDHYSTLSPIRECPEQIKVNRIDGSIRSGTKNVKDNVSYALLFIHYFNQSPFRCIVFILHTILLVFSLFKTFEMYRTLMCSACKVGQFWVVLVNVIAVINVLIDFSGGHNEHNELKSSQYRSWIETDLALCGQYAAWRSAIPTSSSTTWLWIQWRSTAA